MSEIRFALYSRTSTEDHQDLESSRSWQRTRAQDLIGAVGQITVEYFDEGVSRNLPWPDRPEAARLLKDAKRADRPFDAVVIGEYSRAFSGDQHASVVPMLSDLGLPLWIPGLGLVNLDEFSHETLMSLNGIMSKHERQAMRVRVGTAMRSLVESGQRGFMGGRPPYGYELVDLPDLHPNPEKANLGLHLRRLQPRSDTAPVVRRIFREYGEGRGLRSIAQGLTDEGIPCPSASDRKRNPGRNGLAWSHTAVREILKNGERYRGFTIHGRVRKREVLRDPTNPARGYKTIRERAPEDTWVRSPEPTHQALITEETWNLVRARLARRNTGGDKRTPRKPRTPKHPGRVYLLSGRLRCSICGKRLQGQTNRSRILYRCRFRDQYAATAAHPKNVYVAEEAIMPGLHDWLSDLFAPDRIAETAAQIAAAASTADPTADERRRLQAVVSKADTDLRNLLDVVKAGGQANVLADEINRTQQRRDEAARALHALDSSSGPSLTTDDIEAIVREKGAGLLDDLPPLELREVFDEMGLRLDYDPESRTVTGEIDLAASTRWGYVRVGGGSSTVTPQGLGEGRFRVVTHCP